MRQEMWEEVVEMVVGGGAGKMPLLNYHKDPHHDGVVSEMEILPPLLRVNTTSYVDNQLVGDYIVSHLHRRVAQSPGSNNLQALILSGDWQTFERIHATKNFDPHSYNTIIPNLGLFHFCTHTGMSHFPLWHPKLFHGAISWLGHHNTVKEKWEVKQFLHHDIFMLKYIQAAIQYFHELVPNQDLSVLKDTARMKRLLKDNYTAELLFECIQSHGAEHVKLRFNNRKVGTPRVMDQINHLLVSSHETCHFTGKSNYSRGTMQALYLRSNLIPSLSTLLPKFHSKSWLGLDGHRMVDDHMVEKVNNAAQRIVGSVVTDARVVSEIPKLNVTIPIQRQLGSMLHPGVHVSEKPHLPNLEEDVASLVTMFKAKVGHDFNALCNPPHTQHNNPSQNKFSGRTKSQDGDQLPLDRLASNLESCMGQSSSVVGRIRY
jgi:hypothetical protein